MMHKIKIITALLLTGSLVACKKEDKTEEQGNTWTLGATTYKVLHAEQDSNRLDIWEESIDNSASFVFAQFPKRSGKYKIVGRESIGADEVGLLSIRKNSATGVMAGFLSKSKGESLYADVTIAAGKRMVVVEPVWLYNSPLDSALFSCRVTW